MTSEPPAEDQGSRMERLFDLGNHHKLIAIATLVTIATGVPYLVKAVVGVFAETADDEEISATELQEYLAASFAQLRVEARLAVASGRMPLNADALDAAEGALQSLGSAAAAPTATPEERDRIFQAFQRHASGSPTAALEEFQRIAEGQESRGALEDAAATWRQRASLQQFTDADAAVSDLLRAESLAPGGAAELMELSQLQSATGDGDASCQTLRRAVRAAEAEQNDRLLAIGLVRLGKFSGVSWWEEPAWEEEQAQAQARSLEVLQRVLAADPNELSLVPAYATALSVDGFKSLRAGGTPGPPIASLRQLLEQVRAADPHGAAPLAQEVALLAVQKDLAFFLDRSAEDPAAVAAEVDALYASCLALAEQILASPESEIPQLRMTFKIVGDAYWHAAGKRDFEPALDAANLELRIADDLAKEYSGSAVAGYLLSTAHSHCADALVGLDRVDEAIVHYEACAAAARDSASFQPEGGAAVIEIANSYWVAAMAMPEEHAEQALTWMVEAGRVLREEATDPELADFVADFLGTVEAEIAKRSPSG